MNLNLLKSKIHEVRGQKVMLDFDLAELYETETKRMVEDNTPSIYRLLSPNKA